MLVSVEDAYQEALRCLGEAVIRERFLHAELARRNEELTLALSQAQANEPAEVTHE